MMTLHFGPLMRVATLAAMSFLLAGCGKDASPIPTADQAGHSLQDQVYKLLFVTDVQDSQITDAAFDKYVPCGGGKVKVTYAVAGKPTRFATIGGSAVSRVETKKTATPSQIIDDLVRFLPEVGTFSITERRSADATVKLVNAKTYTRLTLHSPGPDRLMISGETDCLRKGVPIH